MAAAAAAIIRPLKEETNSCCWLLVTAAAAAAKSKKTTARHPFRNPLETAKHHPISRQKWRKISCNNTLLGGRNVPSEILLEIQFCCCWWLLLLLVLLLLRLLLPSTIVESKKATARHAFWNPLETAKHHLISWQKWRKISRNNTLLGGRNVPSEILLEIKFWLLLLVAAAPAAAAAGAAAGGCCCCCCSNQQASKGRNQQLLLATGYWLLLLLLLPKARKRQPDTLFETHSKQQNTTQFRAKNDAKLVAITHTSEAGTSLLKSY